MLIGSYEHALDAKNRIFIPSKWRECIGDTIILVQGLLEDRELSCLFGMSMNSWESFSQRLSSLPVTDMAGQMIRRRIYASAASCELDRQGRILLPSALKTVSGIQKDALLIGVGDRIELWDPMQYNLYNERMEESYGTALEHLSLMGV